MSYKRFLDIEFLRIKRALFYDKYSELLDQGKQG
jgi:hypothetical protein